MGKYTIYWFRWVWILFSVSLHHKTHNHVCIYTTEVWRTTRYLNWYREERFPALAFSPLHVHKHLKNGQNTSRNFDEMCPLWHLCVDQIKKFNLPNKCFVFYKRGERWSNGRRTKLNTVRVLFYINVHILDNFTYFIIFFVLLLLPTPL